MSSRRKSITGESAHITPLKHLSYSTLSSWFECPKAVQLAKERRAPRRTAWWFAGGSAVHAASDAYDQWSLLDAVSRPRFHLREEWEKAFDSEVDDITERHPDRSLWRHAGGKEAPETYQRWKYVLGPELVANYVRWRQRSPWRLWHTPQGVPAIELDLSTTFPGCDREVKAYVDRVFTDPATNDLIVVDFKSGTRAPNSPLQFGVYGAGMIELYGEPCTWGYPFMNRKAALGKPYSLSKYTPEYVGDLFRQLGNAIEAGVWPAHLGSSCRMCDVADACYANDGEHSQTYDPAHPEYRNDVPF